MRSIVHTAGRLAKHLPSRDTDRTLAIAKTDISGYYTVPEGYIALVQRFQPGFIVLSYVIAFFGSLCTVELLIRRTTNNGWRNQVLLTLAGFCFGAVSTFSMHFVFNNALTLRNPSDRNGNVIYLMYEPGFTVLSLIASCAAMTIAFFVMGTRLTDWYCVPRRRQRLGRAKEEEERKSTEEYNKWKSTHKKVLKRGTVGVGALITQASKVVKWSLIEGKKEGVPPNWKAFVGKGSMESKGWDESQYGEGETEEDMIRKDKRLAELDFRFGRSAVKSELERRNDYATSSNASGSAPSPIPPNESSVRLMPSDSSLPASPLPVYYPFGIRRNSAPIDIPQNEVFTPGYNIPTRIKTDIAPQPSPNSAPATDALWPPVNLDTPLGLPYLSRRRASLPIAMLPREPAPAPTTSYNTTLTRIQSLPDADLESAPTASAFPGMEQTLEKANAPATATLSLSAQLTLEDERVISPTGKRVPVKAQPALNRVEKFLGFDVVTRVEIIKIFLTGTIAGFGVAAMHYIGQASITGIPYIAYKPAYIVGSVIIASGAVVIALYIMFIMLRPKLKHNWISKIIVAAILAVAVCMMHFCGKCKSVLSRGIC
jgi:NO-binding membrane sensor protein with MHYT domain